jgi:very-short-patch-repair endonuclease
MDVVTALSQLGGEASPSALRALASKSAVRTAIEQRQVLRIRQGVIALPQLHAAKAAARDANGAVSHLSAALLYGWAVKKEPGMPHVTVPRNRRLSPARREGMTLHWGVLTPEELEGRLTSPERTVVDCARLLPFDEALSVADSALRSGLVNAAELRRTAGESSRIGRALVEAVVTAADGRADNPFESCLRAIALQINGLHVEPQVRIGSHRVDLADPRLRLVLEADSREFHSKAEDFRKDVRRYTALVRDGWIVLRFLWDDVMNHPDEVEATIADVVRRLQQG